MSWSRRNMAKDVIKKKQRIAHNKVNEGHEMYPECSDILASIFQGMDNNDLMAAMCMNNTQTNLPETKKITFHDKPQSSVNQIPSRSHTSLPKLNKLGLCRKGPLMAKSQRTLQQLQHNRKVPKPRAHLAGLSNSQSFGNSVSSEKLKTKGVNNARNINKFQSKEVTEEQVYNKIAADRNKMKRNFEKSKSKETTSKKLKPSVMEKSHVKESSYITKSVSKKQDSANVKKSTEKASHVVNNCDKIVNNSSDSDEYEKFIQKEKKDLPNKSKKNNSKKSQKTLKKNSKKHASKSVSTESESDLTDEESSNSYKKKKLRKTHSMLDNRQSTNSIKDKVPINVSRKKNLRAKYVSPSSDSEMSEGPSTSYKKRKKVYETQNNRTSVTSKDDSESQMDINDETYHNSSSDSDDLPPPSEIICRLPSANNLFSVQMDNQRKPEIRLNSNEVYNIPSMLSRDEPNILCNKTSSCEIAPLVNSNQPNISQNKTFSHETPKIASMVNSDQPNVLHKSSGTHSLVSSAQPSVSHKPLHLSLGSVHTNGVALQNNSRPNSPKSLVIDLGESDNECETSFTVFPKIVTTSSHSKDDFQSYSEDSEIELVDVIVPDSPVHCSDNRNSCNESNIKTEKINETTHLAQHSNNANESNIKTEKINETTHNTAKSRKYEVTYTTGICHKPDINESKDKIMKQFNLNDKFHHEKSKSEDKIVKVKKELSDGDECEIILDTNSTSNSITNLSSVQIESNTNIKVEKDSEAVKQAVAIQNINEGPVGTRESRVVENAKDLHILNKKVKKEPSDGDECEIILDSSTNLCNVQIHDSKNIKVERDSKAVKQAIAIHIANDGPNGSREKSKLTEKEQKLHEISCNTLINSHNRIVQPMENETINDLNSLTIKALLENLKKEFQTYQEIITTEQSVETTFKLLEKCQAERLQSLKTKIIQCLESVPSSSDSNSFKIAMNDLLVSQSLKHGNKTSSVCPSDSSTDISMQDLKTLATMNIVPLSSISEQDIKPNLSDLQCAVKQEPSSLYEINSMSFGEKCIVCAKDASAACQQCAKVFFCSNECGRKYWEDGHKNACVK